MPADFEIVIDLSPSGKYMAGFKEKMDKAFLAMAERTASGASSNTVRVITGNICFQCPNILLHHLCHSSWLSS